jgi:transcriptional regulator with XRE-family HTH domain
VEHKTVSHNEVREQMILELKKANRYSSINNYIATHNIYLKSLCIKITNSANDLLNLENAILRFKNKCTFSKSTWPSKKTHIKRLNNAYLKLIEFKQMPKGFSARLAHLIAKSGKQLKEIEQDTGISAYLLGIWRKQNRRPSKEKLEDVKKLEEYFNVLENTLTGQLPKKLYGSKAYTIRNLKRSTHGKYTLLATRESYGLHEWPDKDEIFWQDMVNHFQLRKPKYRSRKVTIIKINGFFRNSQAHWGSVSTINLKRWHISSFFGFLTLPKKTKNPRLRGLGYKTNEISIALLTDPDLISKYLDFKAERARWGLEKQDDGKDKIVLLHNKAIYSNELEKFLEALITWTKTTTGYLRQREDLKQYIDTGGLSWELWIDKAIEKFVEYIRTIDFTKTRKWDDKIGYILKDPSQSGF